MNRPTWTPQTEEHRRLVAKVVEAARAADEVNAALWAAFAEARQGGVSLSYVADEAGVSRATVYRHLPKD